MNHLSPFFNTTIAAVIFAMLLFPYYLLRKWKSRASKGIPAPQPQAAWPLIGHLPLLSGSDPPHITLAALANTCGPLFSIRLGIQFVLVVSCLKVGKELFTGVNDVIVTFRPALVAGKLMGYNYALFPFTPGGLYWRETRKISTLELLSNRRLELLKHIRNQEFGAGADGDEKEGRQFQERTTTLLHYLGTLVLRDAVPFLGWMDVDGHEKAMKKTAKELDNLLDKWLQEHERNRYFGEKSKEDQDFMDVLLSALDGKSIEGYDADTINKAVSLSMVAGNETIAVAMTWALALLLNHKPVLRKAQKGLDEVIGKERLVNDKDISKLVYLLAIVKGTLRLYPPAFISGPRQFTGDCNINPMVFKPERFLTTHNNVDVRSHKFEMLPFGGGRRACPGASYALQIIHLTMATLLQAFEISTSSDAAIDMTPGVGLTNMKTTPLEVVFSPRLPLCCFE
uniref:Cytochrome P450 n=1 Tax=Manihot esculenta TaxID=3983 RepID=A0A2C9U0T3_MANES